jgi:3',5'-cyclic AMP phosphodiesterase CpdA
MLKVAFAEKVLMKPGAPKSGPRGLQPMVAVTAIHLLLAGCGGPATHLVLLGDGDSVRVVPATSGCPDGWNSADYDDDSWDPMLLPVDSSAGRCLRAHFDANTDLSRYRWLAITLSARSQAILTSSKPLGERGGFGSIDWSTADGDDDTGGAMPANKTYTLDLALFPDLIQTQHNVLALEMAASSHPVEVAAELVVDTADSDFVQPVKGPYSVRPSGGAARVVWETSKSAPSWMEVDEKQYSGGWSVHHEVPLTGLALQTVHPVYVENAEANALPPSCAASVVSTASTHAPVFKPLAIADNAWWNYIERRNLCQQLADAVRSPPSLLRPAGPAAARLVIVGETRANDELDASILTAAVGETPDLIVHTGDLVDEAVEGDWQALFDRAQPLLAVAPIAPAPGERDAALGVDRFGQLFAVTTTGIAGHVYSVDEGPAHVAVLDSTGDMPAAAAWLDADLTSATANGATQLFVVMHRGPWSAGPLGGSDEAAAFVAPVATRHGVRAIIGGHDAIYEHGIVGAQHYFVTGGAGAHSDTPTPLPSTVTTSSAAHYLVVDVTPASVRVQAKDAGGNVLDDVTLK